jgi:2-iminobutanoate/2-iminopropanoate deaminase
MNRQSNCITEKVFEEISKHTGNNSDAVVVNETNQAIWVFTTGTPGIDESGKYADNIIEQNKQVWRNILKILTASKLSADYIVKITATLTDPEYIEPYVGVRKEILGDLKPVLMLFVVNQTFKPEIMVENRGSDVWCIRR